LSPRAFLKAAILAAFVAVATSGAAWANILIVIDKTAQRMSVTVDGVQRYTWPVSTGRPGYSTPSGTFTPFRMEADHFSQEWDDAPMPHSIFFTRQGHAIHGSYHSGLGAPRSHGCVRISPPNAAILYSLVQAEGLGKTKVVLTGTEAGGGFGFGFGGNQSGMFPFRQY
jgi:lipoprotein-anchoring transpeptidase ErfK/SrfK